MAIVRWEPIRELNTLQNEVDRLLTSFFDPRVSSTRGNGGGQARWAPAMDLLETENEFVLRADLPGMSQEDVAIELQDDVLTLSGERKAEHSERKEGYHRVERAYGSFARTLTLPAGTDPSAIKANFDRGVLEVRIPKPAESQPHRVKIEVGDTTKVDSPAIEGAEAKS